MIDEKSPLYRIKKDSNCDGDRKYKIYKKTGRKRLFGGITYSYKYVYTSDILETLEDAVKRVKKLKRNDEKAKREKETDGWVSEDELRMAQL